MEQNPEWTDVESPDEMDNQHVLKIVGLLWRFKWILAFGLIVGLALGYLYFLRQTPVYKSSAQILLVKRQAQLPIAGVEGTAGYEDTLATQILLLRSPVIVGRAVEEHDLRSLDSFQGMKNPTGAIIGRLEASPASEGSGQVISLTYVGTKPEDCAAVLNAVIQSYEAFLGKNYQDFGEETTRLLSQAKDELDRELTALEAERQTFRQAAPLWWQGEDAVNPHQARMAAIETSRSELLLAIAQAKSQINGIETVLKEEGCNREALKMLLGSLNESNDSQTVLDPQKNANAQLFELFVQEQLLLLDFGPDHPKVQALRKRIELVREHMKDLQLLEEQGDTPADFFAVYVESLRQEIQFAEKKLAELDALFEKEQEASRELAIAQNRDRTYASKIARKNEMFNACVKRLDELNLVKDYNSINTEVISPPRKGGLVRPVFATIMGMFGICGLMAGFGIAWLVDFADRRFRSPDEIRRQLGVPLVGHIPVLEIRRGEPVRTNGRAVKTKLDGSLCTFHRPKGQQAEAYRAVRTSLYFSARSEGHKVIQVTSPNPRDGKSTLAANLALSIAKSGKRVLLLEADFRRPRIHRLFGIDNKTGVTSVLTGDCELPEAAHQTAVENLTVMPCGPRPQNASDLLTTPRFKELIDTVRDEYDFVIVDTPPLLAVSDPAVVAPRTDAVLIVIRLTKHARDAAKRATEILENLGTKILGVVVNGIGKSSGYGGYGYGGYGYKYGYGYRYGYGYSYGYGYGEKKNHYYSDEETEEDARAGAEEEAASSSAEREPD